MSSRAMHRFLENLGSGAGGSADGRLSPQDAMARFRERVAQHVQESQERREAQEEMQQTRVNRVDAIWQRAAEEANDQKEGA